MKTVYIDEFGAFGFQFDKSDCSSHYIICAIVLEEAEIPSLESGLEAVRKKFFQTGEMKS